MFFARFLDQGARIDPEGTVLLQGDRRWRYAEVQAFTRRFARRARDAGFAPGSRGAVLSLNDAVAFQCAFGLHRAGMSWIPMNPKNGEDDARYTLDMFECDLLVFHSRFADMVRAIRPQLPRIAAYVCLDRRIDDIPSLDEWLSGVPDDWTDLPLDNDALAIIMPTGGTTGRPKGVMLTERNLAAMVATYLFSFVYRAGERPVAMVAAPLTHAAGPLAVPAIARGGAVAILPAPDIDTMLDTIETHQVTEFFLPPTLIYRMLDHPGVGDRNLRSVRYFGYGSAPMSVEKLKRAIRLFGPCLTQFYGQSEAPALCTFLAPEEHVDGDGEPASDRVLSSCGRPTALIELRILDADDREVPAGEMGEVCVRGDLVTPGYYRQPELTAAAIVDGWLHTGDIGFLDGEGRLHVCDRKKDMIISGGLNIYPQEIEQVIWSHPAVADCAVIGVPDEEWGELVTAVVETIEGQDISADAVLGLCRQRLGSVKCPKRVDFVDALPRSPNGKVLKRVLRDRYWAAVGRRI
ncbi:AMP-binding protein [Rhizorhabdus wittichii]|uniref:3-methylmercaptopropionyl-CoA ligase n=1 Tax=Rhizorhabdus wittichii TaxID=160791 RepID=A0A975HF96_9SPHN|nr:AMP-binding protein [Rhizorhabdus wittichii]QTH23157.1 AMP-binding protein [Rhizorhabdus wittichii]